MSLVAQIFTFTGARLSLQGSPVAATGLCRDPRESSPQSRSQFHSVSLKLIWTLYCYLSLNIEFSDQVPNVTKYAAHQHGLLPSTP